MSSDGLALDAVSVHHCYFGTVRLSWSSAWVMLLARVFDWTHCWWYALLFIDLMLCGMEEENERISYLDIVVCFKCSRCEAGLCQSLTRINCFHVRTETVVFCHGWIGVSLVHRLIFKSCGVDISCWAWRCAARQGSRYDNAITAGGASTSNNNLRDEPESLVGRRTPIN